MTPQRMREAAQILGEIGNGKMANELEELAEETERSILKRRYTEYALPALKVCTRVQGHDGPCNGFPRRDCPTLGGPSWQLGG